MKIKILFAAILIATSISAVLAQGTQGRKLYAGATKSRSAGSVPISRKIAYPWTWSAGLGYTVYYGQLAKPFKSAFDFDGLKDINFFLGVRYRFNSRFSAGGTLRYQQMSGSDKGGDIPLAQGGAGRYERNLSFFTTGPEFIIYGQFDIIPFLTRWMGDKIDQHNRRNPIVPYAHLGVGFFMFNPKATLNNETYSLRNYKTDSYKATHGAYSNITPIINYGAGVRVKLNEFLDISAEATITKTFTDYIDDVKGNTNYYVSEQAKNGGFYDPMSGNWTIFDYNYFYNNDLTIDDKLSYRGNEVTGNTKTWGAEKSPRGGFQSINDTYFMLNFKIDYTLSHIFMFHNPQHRHFGKGKGTKHHKFIRR